MTGDNGVFAWVLARTEGAFRLVEAEAGFAACRVRPVASETTIAQNWPDVAIVTERRVRAADSHPEYEGNTNENEFGPLLSHDDG
jgi:hypothetical protein